MLINRINGTTRVLGKSQGYLGLPVRDYVIGDSPAIDTSWTPTPDELEKLNAGASLILTLLCFTPPPMRINVAGCDPVLSRNSTPERVQELLEANNRYRERALTAEAALDNLRRYGEPVARSGSGEPGTLLRFGNGKWFFLADAAKPTPPNTPGA